MAAACIARHAAAVFINVFVADKYARDIFELSGRLPPGAQR